MQQRLVAAVFFGALATTTLMTGCQKTIKPQEKKPIKLAKLEQSISVLTPISAVSLPQSHGRFGKKFNKKYTPELHVANLPQAFAAAGRSGVVSVYRKNGQLLWSVDIKEEITGGISTNTSANVLVVSTRSGQVVAIDTANQKIRWQIQLPSTSLAPSLVSDDRVMVSANDGIIYALDIKTGEQVWQFSTQMPTVSVRGIAKPLQLDDHTALFGTADGRIHAIDPQTGEPLWTRRIGRAVGGSQVNRMSDVDGSPLVVGNHLYVASYSGQLLGFDMNTGQLMFGSTLASIQPLVAIEKHLIGVSIDGDVVAFNRLTGEEVWKNTELKYRKLTNPVVVGEYVAVGDFEGVIHLLDKSGKIVSRTTTKGKLNSLQVFDNQLYTQNTDGVVSLWRFD